MLLLAGCATGLQAPGLKDSVAGLGPVELESVPFFPQTEYQCGPAALATVLNWSGTAVTPGDLAPAVYLPGRRGSLQLELQAAARRFGRVPYVLEPRLDHLLQEVAAGHPVLVLQNLGTGWFPRWHYAVAVGFDLARQEMVLRSGTRRAYRIDLALFEHTWRRGGRWALLVLPPDRLPRTATAGRYLAAVNTLEQTGKLRAARTGYRTALDRWPRNYAALMGLGNTAYLLKDLRQAERAFRRAAARRPGEGAAYNNLAQVLLALGRRREAGVMARKAVAAGGPWVDIYIETLEQTL